MAELKTRPTGAGRLAGSARRGLTAGRDRGTWRVQAEAATGMSRAADTSRSNQ